jgi:esterase/lipase superfamily enzyme
MRVFFGTDRTPTGSQKAAEMFGNGRNEQGPISRGTCDVSIPRDHRMGELEAPSILRLEFSEDPAKHVVLLDPIRQLSIDDFHAEISKRVKGSPSKQAFVFVHGYKVSFEDAARRTAQMAYDLAFDGAPAFFAWPSKGALLEYGQDEKTIEWATKDIKAFLEDFARNSGAERIHVIAHSMGNRGVTRALIALTTEHPELRGRFQDLILAAPDIDASVYESEIAPKIPSTASAVTIYASSKDEALVLAKKVFGYRRVGESDPEPVVTPGVETVDASNVSTDLIGHSYYGESRSVIADIFGIIHGEPHASNRFGMRAATAKGGPYWVFAK